MEGEPVTHRLLKKLNIAMWVLKKSFIAKYICSRLLTWQYICSKGAAVVFDCTFAHYMAREERYDKI